MIDCPDCTEAGRDVMLIQCVTRDRKTTFVAQCCEPCPDLDTLVSVDGVELPDNVTVSDRIRDGYDAWDEAYAQLDGEGGLTLCEIELACASCRIANRPLGNSWPMWGVGSRNGLHGVYARSLECPECCAGIAPADLVHALCELSDDVHSQCDSIDGPDCWTTELRDERKRAYDSVERVA